MNPMLIQWLAPAVVFLLTLASGVWVSRIGRPLNIVVSTLHKLIALAAVIWAGSVLYGMARATGLQPVAVALVFVAGAGVVALFTTGALLSQAKPTRRIILGVHQVAPALAVVAASTAVYLLAVAR
jgi:hypothetical protein